MRREKRKTCCEDVLWWSGPAAVVCCDVYVCEINNKRNTAKNMS
jgi:hypothetical protein